MTFLDRMIHAARKQVAYIRTRDAIASLPLATQLDFDIFVDDSARIAHRVVFG